VREKHRWKIKRWLLLLISPVAVLAIVAAVIFLSPRPAPQSRYTVGRTTTFVDGPVAQDGYIDYVTALNERLRGSIRPAENANVLIWRMFGPHPEGRGTMPPSYFRWLGMERPPEQGDYWIRRERFLQERSGLGPRAHLLANVDDLILVDQQFDQAQRGPWKRKTFTWLAAWLEANARPLDLALQASQCSEYYNPLVPGGMNASYSTLMDSLLPNVQMCREVAQALVCRAMLELDEGRVDHAWRDLLACHRLGRLIAEGGTGVEMLVSLAIDQVADRADLAVTAHGRLDSKSLLAKLNELRRLPPFPSLADKVDLAERCLFLDSVALIMRHGASGMEFLAGRKPDLASASLLERIERAWLDWRLDHVNWDLVLRSGNEWYDRLVGVVRLPDRSEREAELAACTADLNNLSKSALARSQWAVFLSPTDTDQTMADILIGLMLPAVPKLQVAVDQNAQRQNNLYLAFALAAYRQDHGVYPKALSALLPNYLREMPADLFSGQPLIYRPRADGYLLYSVGVNGKDEQGRGYEDNPPGDDVSVYMPLARQAERP